MHRPSRPTTLPGLLLRAAWLKRKPLGGALAVVALQEITDPAAFCGAARRRLGPSWGCAFTDRPGQRVGLLHDRSALELLSTTIHGQTELQKGAKPVLEARLRPVAEGSPIRMF